MTWTSRALKYDEAPWVLDQTRLPHETHWIRADTIDIMVECIQSLRVRGAPLIATAAVLGLYHFVRTSRPNHAEFIEAWTRMRASRPTAVNLMNDLDDMRAHTSESISEAQLKPWVLQYLERELLCYAKLADHGAQILANHDRILTHCNTGGLATYGMGTALGVITRAWETGKSIHVYVDETRPLLQGARLTAWELTQSKIPHTLICDNMAGFLMSQGKVSKVIVGADRITRNGDFANKIGTYSVAVLAYHHRIPFYVAAPWATVDLKLSNGADIPIEERGAHEVKGYSSLTWAPDASQVFNPAFDVTPHEMVTGYIFETGILTAQEIERR